ncbi:MAG: AIR synthase-related protein, partial [Desulfobaccales bacterium]
YAGLDPWEIWVSESQERMVVGLDPGNREPFESLARRHEVEVSVIGRFTDRGVLEVSHDGRPCASMDLSFLEEDFPPWEFEAEWLPPVMRLVEPVLGEIADHRRLLLAMLARPNICSREWITRQYDHEVQGMSVIKPLTGRDCPVPADAAALRPDLNGHRGLAVSLALNPAYSQIDAYHMAAGTIDEAVRRLVAVGADLDIMGGVDNFCWPSVEYHPEKNPDGKFKAAQLVRACWALRDMCLAYDMPLLSGKDSMYVDGVLPGRFGETHRVSGLPTLFFTVVSVIPDLKKVVNLDFKAPGDLIYIVGATQPELGASEFYEMLGYVGLTVPQVRPPEFLSCYQAMSRAIAEEILASCHGIYRGGLGVHLALCSLAGGLGVEVDLDEILSDFPTHAALYSESAGRFLVSVAPAQRRQFEEILQGQPYQLLGEVRPDREFTMKRQGRALLTVTLDELKEAWTSPFGKLV